MDMHDFLEGILPLAAVFIIFGFPVAAFVIFRVLAHRERMEMIRHGVVPPGRRGWRTPSAPAAAPGPMPVGPAAVVIEDQLEAQALLRKGIGLTMVGLALSIGLSFIGFWTGHFTLGPWMLGGLIPLFIGLGQVIVALISGASLGNLTPRQGPPPGWQGGYQAKGVYPGQPGYPPPGGYPPETAYGYRPEETQGFPTVQPPERRVP